jgi:hypothetical protein
LKEGHEALCDEQGLQTVSEPWREQHPVFAVHTMPFGVTRQRTISGSPHAYFLQCVSNAHEATLSLQRYMALTPQQLTADLAFLNASQSVMADGAVMPERLEAAATVAPQATQAASVELKTSLPTVLKRARRPMAEHLPDRINPGGLAD